MSFANSETLLNANPAPIFSNVPQLKPASSTDTASTSSELTADNAPPTRVESVLKAADLSPEAVTSPLEALALACVAEKATSEEAQEQQSTEFTSNDVLCGRGGLTNNAPGNIFFRKLVRMKQQVYLLASKREKAGVAREIVETIRSLSPPGRFLKKDSNGVYVDIGDRKAREKTSQALREGAPNIRQGLGGSTCTTIPVGVASPTTMMTLEEPTYMIGQTTATTASIFHQPRKFLKPDPWMPSNRARVVSDDSVGIQACMMAEAQEGPAPPTVAGSKRKVGCSLEDKRPEETGNGIHRGPRLLRFKSRLMS